MQASLLICTLLFTAAFAASPLRTGEDTVYHVAECVKKAIDGGLPAAGIPNHNPLTFHKNFSKVIGEGQLVSTEIDITTIQIHGLVDFGFDQLTGEWHEDTKEINYNFSVVYPEVNITFDYEVDMRALFFSKKISGSTVLRMENFTFSGAYGQNTETWNLDQFDLQLHTTNVEFSITGLEPDVTEIANRAVADTVFLFVNSNVPLVVETFSAALQAKLNRDWFNSEKWYRVQAILDNC